MSRFCDLVVSGGIFFLLLFTPFAFGAVHPWAYIVMESAIFSLVAAAMTKLIYLRRWPGLLGSYGLRLAAPLLLFIALISFQLLPIPAALLAILSPNGYALYQASLAGWPEKPPFADLLEGRSVTPAQPELLPTPDQIRRGATTPFDDHGATEKATVDELTARTKLLLPSAWRPLSIAPSLTVTQLLKIIAYGSLFFLIVLYPFGSAKPAGSSATNARQGAEATFLRSLLVVVLGCAFAVALVGIGQLFVGNGKILGIFVPYDWDPLTFGARFRASGPFINP
ncbi:MAG: hypothetical protein ACREPG_08955, partial [Candidatus Binatia bacterium]